MTLEADGRGAAEDFMEKVFGDYVGANAIFMAAIGDRLGLFKDFASNGPATSAELAARTGLAERYLREWLDGMAAAGYLIFDEADGRYSMPEAYAPVLAEESGMMFLGAAFFDYSTNYGETFHALLEAFRSGDGVPQELYGQEVAESIERFTAPWFEHQLVPVWLPLMPEARARLEAGARVCDVGCGQGRAVIKLAQAFPECELVGLDRYEPAIQAATEHARAAGVGDRVRFELHDGAAGLPGRFDVVTTFDVLHDSADPAGLLAAIHDGLDPEGRYVCVDINCADRSQDNVGPMGTVLYGLSLAYCLPVSLARGGAGLGTCGLPEGRLREMALAAGFSQVRRLPVDDPFNNVYELSR
ncbi:class I SAM-dependent methyltransferase [Nonomuraea africana]|uniref:SAM-dependent methyltransferase n=1 Tax=Nonomuraea africana TaxID=46171 RepID=A0ABR9K7P8_9ACTN|nr:class I SAM-dependent methyltransferase [Nonomuraea africana]MBE1558038.1 SAM-dependent methyltransferase [Nonomuraea africana]